MKARHGEEDMTLFGFFWLAYPFWGSFLTAYLSCSFQESEFAGAITYFGLFVFLCTGYYAFVLVKDVWLIVKLLIAFAYYVGGAFFGFLIMWGTFCSFCPYCV
jgi:hypothetical protein